ncbi:MAG TPA: peptide chain release factor-like protein [Parachlamydiales bacterium]|nr:peptide chain release factor-like protein [Parachlamydiales bacterium]HCJ83700.1 peptide chain release factor-like protein [Parachlamydiales bacterium]
MLKEKQAALAFRMKNLGIQETDLMEKFILGSGSGGQKVNKTSSCVYLRHEPTGLEVKCHKERSRELNRYYARLRLCELLEKENAHIKTEKEKLIEKKRRQKRRRSRKAKEKMLAAKRERAQLKMLRHLPEQA